MSLQDRVPGGRRHPGRCRDRPGRGDLRGARARTSRCWCSASPRRRRPRPTGWCRTTSGRATSARARPRPRRAAGRSRRSSPRTGLSALVAAQYIDRGTVATLAARFARYADLTLITPQAEGFESMQSWVMNGALFESGRPILLLPKGPVRLPGGAAGDDRLGRQRRGLEGGARRDRADEEGRGGARGADRPGAVVRGPRPRARRRPRRLPRAPRHRGDRPPAAEARARRPASCCAAPRPTSAPT